MFIIPPHGFKMAAAAAAKSRQSCPTLCDPLDSSPIRLRRPWDSPGKNAGVGGCPAPNIIHVHVPRRTKMEKYVEKTEKKGEI